MACIRLVRLPQAYHKTQCSFPEVLPNASHFFECNAELLKFARLLNRDPVSRILRYKLISQTVVSTRWKSKIIASFSF